ncbi:DUF5979 domain-containing protein [Oerskovia turbata]
MSRGRRLAMARGRRFVTLAVTAVLVVLAGIVAVGGPAQAQPDPDGGVSAPGGIFTELTITGFGAGQAVAGSRAPAGFDPLAGYPATVPVGSTPDNATFAGAIQVTDPVSGQVTLTYCIDLLTDTTSGVHYQVGTWDEANVPLLGYIGYILTRYYPLTGEPAGAPNDNARGAAVQAAIWFFSDAYVLAVGDPVRPFVEAIVADALANGPQPEPTPPTLEVSPSTLAAPSTGEIVGPFIVTADGPSTIRSVGVEVFADQAGTIPLPDGAVVQPGATLWARSVSAVTPQGFVLDRVTTVLESTVYLYDNSNPGRQTAQKLVLAQPTELARRAGALLVPFAAGALEVDKVVTGDGAGLQSDVVLTVTCTSAGGDVVAERTVTVPAGAAAGSHPQVIGGLPAESECVVAETQNGDNGRVVVTATSVEPASVLISNGDTVTVTVTNSYDVAVGSLRVSKAFAGPAAGGQGEVVLAIRCDDPVGAFDREVTVPRGLGAGSHEAVVIDGIPAGTTCAVTEIANGGTSTAVWQSVAIEPASGAIVEGQVTDVLVTNTYGAPTAATAPVSFQGPAALAATGASPAPLAVLAALLLAAGLTTVVAFHRRR